MPFSIEQARAAVEALNAKLKPIAERPVDINDRSFLAEPSWPSALDEAGVREEAESLMLAIVHAYGSGTSAQRDQIRELLRENPAFQWATGVRASPTTPEGLRLQLLRLSAAAETEDPRDLMVHLNELFGTASAAGVKAESIIEEVAKLSGPRVSQILSSGKKDS